MAGPDSIERSSEETYEDPPASLLGDLFIIFVITANAIGIGYFLTLVQSRILVQPKMEPWLLARASGITAYVMLWLLVMAGLMLSHPMRHKFKFLHPVTRMRFHTLLAVFTLSFVALHILTVILDAYAQVGLEGALIPFKSKYRTLPVALGTLGVYAGLITGISARTKIGFGARGWITVHRFSILVLILIWGHAVYAGTDSVSLGVVYLSTAFLTIIFGLSRYTMQKPAVNNTLGKKP